MISKDGSPFFGREKEISLARKIIKEGSGLLGFYGVGGVGKTRLLSEIKEKCGEKHIPVIWIQGNRLTDGFELINLLLYQLREFFPAFSLELQSIERSITNKRSDFTPKIEISNSKVGVVEVGAFGMTGEININLDFSFAEELVSWRTELLEDSIREIRKFLYIEKLKVIFFFDALEWVSETTLPFVQFAISSLAQQSATFCAGRVRLSDLTPNLLEELPKFEAINFLYHLGVPESFHKSITNLTRIPLCLELAAQFISFEKATPAVFDSYDADTDNANFITDFFRKLILDYLRQVSNYSRPAKSKAIVYLLEYGSALSEITPEVLAETLGKIPQFSPYFQYQEKLNDLLSDNLLQTHLLATTPPVFHDLLRELGNKSLEKEQPEMYKQINSLAAKYYARQLSTGGTDFVNNLLIGKLPFEIQTTQLRDPEFSNWRNNFVKFQYHFSRAHPHKALSLVRSLYETVFFGHYENFIEQMLSATNVKNVFVKERAWLLTKRFASGLTKNINDLQEVLNQYDISEIEPEVWIEASTRLLHVYFYTNQLDNAQVLLDRMEILGNKLPGELAAEFYAKLARSFLKSARYPESIVAFEKASSLTNKDWNYAEYQLQIAISLRRQKDFAQAEEKAWFTIELWKKMNNIDKIAEVYIALGDIFRFQNKWELARNSFQEAISQLEGGNLGNEIGETTRERGHRLSLLGTAYGALSRYYIKVREPIRAQLLLEQGIRILERGGNPHFHFGWMKRLLGYSHQLQNDLRRAKILFQEAIEAAKSADNYIPHQIENWIAIRDLYFLTSVNRREIESIRQTIFELVNKTGVPLEQWEADVKNDYFQIQI